jgi:hypothetical protein
MKNRAIIITSIALVFLVIPAVGQAQSQIDAILEDGFIVLGDKTFKIADDAVFLDQHERTKLSLSDFKEGDWVEIDLTPDGEIDEMRMSSEP